MSVPIQVSDENRGFFADGLPIRRIEPAAAKRSLEVFLASETESVEFCLATETLFSYCSDAIADREITPLARRVRKALVERGLNYETVRTRSTAANYLDLLLFHRPLDQIPFWRDALNDPYEGVRSIAVGHLGEFLGKARDAQELGGWCELTRLDSASQTEDRIDEIVDLLIWKGLTDTEWAVWTGVGGALIGVEPNAKRIRSLKRAIDSGVIRDAGALRDAKEALRGWDPAYNAKITAEERAAKQADARAGFETDQPPTSDPFGNPDPPKSSP
jgi:hypothetical protein